MTVSWIVALALNITALFSLRRANRFLSAFEMTANYFIAAAVTHLAFTAVSLNAGKINFKKSASVFWALELYQLMLIPCLLVWLLAALFHPRLRPLQKTVLSLWWIAIMAAVPEMHRKLGLVQFRGWNTGYSLIEYFVILCFCLSFAIWFRSMLRKEGRVNCS